jgi:hypothetical protein
VCGGEGDFFSAPAEEVISGGGERGTRRGRVCQIPCPPWPPRRLLPPHSLSGPAAARRAHGCGGRADADDVWAGSADKAPYLPCIIRRGPPQPLLSSTTAIGGRDGASVPSWGAKTNALFVWLNSHQPSEPAVFFSQNKPATSNQSVVLFSQNESAPASSQTNRLEDALAACRGAGAGPTPTVMKEVLESAGYGKPPFCRPPPVPHCW